ncbi:MAG TPA: hypothetical protein VEY91_00520 [Candidatus Limnocylindria bacterium]|nr:hypothetical protein [Candidatus Limnocylindria bacterium]
MPIAPVLMLAATIAAAPSPTPGPTLAIEDTMQTEVPEVLVRAPRVTLDEILDRVARGEARRESLITDQTFTATVRVVRNVKGDRPELFEESVWRIYRKRPNRLRTVPLRRWSAGKKQGAKAEVDVEFSPGMGERVVNFAFRPNARRGYRYRIVGRDLVGDRVIYRIAFETRSLLDSVSPSGLVWIDTNEFVIVREELEFRRSPVPVLLKGIDRMVVERQRAGEHWVLKRVMMRGEMTLPIPKFGKSFDFAIHYDDYELNRGLSDALFAKPRRGAPAAPAKSGGR